MASFSGKSTEVFPQYTYIQLVLERFAQPTEQKKSAAHRMCPVFIRQPIGNGLHTPIKTIV
jgi:hypothetical protein